MRRKILIGLATLLGFIILFILGVFWYVRSGRLDLYIQGQIVEALKETGIEATIGKTELDLRGYKVNLKNIQLVSIEGKRPIASVEDLLVEFSVVDYLRQKISITNVTVTNPKIWVEIDESDRTNFDLLRAPPEKPEEEESAVNIFTAEIKVTGGEVDLKDRKRNIEAKLSGLSITFAPSESGLPADKIKHSLNLALDRGSAKYEGRPIENIKAAIEATVAGEKSKIDRADLKKFEITSDLGKITAPGQVASIKPFKYALDVRTEAVLGEIARVFAPEQTMSGTVTVAGRLEGTDADYRFNDAVIAADSLTADGFRIAAVRVNSDVTGKETSYDAKLELSAGPVSGSGVSVGSVSLNDAAVTGQDDAFDLTGALAIAALKSGRVTVSSLRGRLEADPTHVRLPQFVASTLGGVVSGAVAIAYGGGQSSVNVQFRGIDLNQAATLVAAKDVTVRGSAQGSARLAFPGLNFEAATGRIDSTFEGSVLPPESDVEAAAATGRVALVATGRGFTIEEAYVKSESSELTATGTVKGRLFSSSSNNDASIEFKFKSDDMSEVQRAIEAFGVVPDNVQEYELAVGGAGEFTGRLEGPLSAPNVTGHLSLESIESRDEAVGSFEGDIAYSPSAVRVERAALVRPDGSRAEFLLNAPIGEENAISLRADVKDFDLAAAVRLGVPSLGDLIGEGRINGTVDLRGLPGPRTIEGTANVTLSGGEFNLPSTDESEETRKVSVPEFAGQVTIANSIVTARDIRLLVADSTITGQGTYNLDTYEYSLDAEGKNIDLSRLGEAIPPSVRLTGRADLTVAGQGKWDDISDINLNATLQGHDVSLNGRSLGDAKVIAFGEGGLLKIEATGDVLDSLHTLTAAIDLRDRKNYPITSEIVLNDEELGPYIELVAPGLSNITGRATGTIKLSGPLLEPDQLQVVMDLSKLEFGGNLAGGQSYTITNQGNIIVTATRKAVSLESVTFTGEGTRVTLGGTISPDAATSNLAINGEINLGLISSFTRDVFVTGIAGVEASVTGTLEAPRLLGSVDLKDVSLRVVDVPVQLARGTGKIRFTTDQAIIDNFTAATSGGGTLTLTGGAAAPPSGLVPDRWRIEARADQVGMEFPRDTQTVFDADLVLQGNRRFQLLSGNVDVRRAAYTKDITLDDLVSGSGPFGSDFLNVGPGGVGGASSGPAISLDIRINANETLIVRNNLADAIGSAFINVRGSVDSPSVSGRVLLSQGTLEFRNDRYELTRGLITFPPGRKIDPIFDFQSEAEISGYQITIGFNGTLAKLQTTLKSEPSLPEGDIVSLILTGNLASRAETASEAATQTGLGLAQSLLSASLSAQLEKGAQRLFGLSRLSVDPLIVGRGNDPTARVTVGQRITKNLTVTYSQNLTSGPSGIDRIVLVEYRISNRFSIVGFRNERSELGFDVRVRKRF
ncbi:MAG: translocation/assembly module TamB domain-containing protein [Blastocatellia bacterium]|nr:translocation/assembly module TamB domain-containing protein [Blastocatellia bacterium]